DRALESMRRLQKLGYISGDIDLDDFERKLLEESIIEISPRGKSLTRKGERDLRHNALERVFGALRKTGRGNHPVPQEGGPTEEALPEKRSFNFGDSSERIDYTSSLFNSIARSGELSLSLIEDDLEVFETEKTTSCATALLLDISHSMILYGEDRITPAKQVAMAIAELITTRYPKDYLTVILFGDSAREVKIEDLPYCGVGPYHTNTKAGLMMARQKLLTRKHPNKQIIMITDGKPSMITRRNGQIYRNPVGLDPIIVNRTLDEAVVCRKKRIPITTFMVTEDPYLRRFIERLTELNRGRAYFSSVDRLGEFVIQDFLTQRRRRA
ncbi:MAG: VWA domain-containing protein, partial [Candidatus Zixiibacteriota bacterium]